MPKVNIKNLQLILVIILIGLTITSVFKYYRSLKEKYDLMGALDKAKVDLAALESDKKLLAEQLSQEKDLKEHLVQENDLLKKNYLDSEEKITALNIEYVSLQSELGQLKARFDALEAKKNSLDTQLGQAVQEKDELKARLSSVVELKKAIRELRKHTHKVNNQIKKEIISNASLDGNRGFLVKEGKPTYAAKIKIEVSPTAPLGAASLKETAPNRP